MKTKKEQIMHLSCMRHTRTYRIFSAIFSIAVAGIMVNASYGYFLPDSNIAKAATTATLSLSPTSLGVSNNQIFSVNIMLDTAGNATDGVDIFSLHFNPAILQVVDADMSLAGVQVTPGSLMPATTANAANNANGTLQFSQASSGGSNFTGSGVLATINFRAIAGGTSAVTIDFTQGNTTDSNVASQGNDLLVSVTNASYSVDATAPATPTGLTATAISTTQINLTWSASTDNIGVTGYKIYRGGTLVATLGNVTSYQNTGLTASTLYTYTVSAFDAAANESGQSASASATTQTPPDTIAPAVSITAPTAGATVSGSAVTISAAAIDNIGVVGVQFKLDGAVLNAEDTTFPYSTAWNTTTATEGGHTLTAVARDSAGNQTTSSSLFATVANNFTRTIQLDLEGRTNKSISGNLAVLNTSKVLIKTYAYTTNSSGLATITFDIPPQVVYLKLNPVPFLARLMSVDLNSNVTYIFPKLLVGDLNQDNIINSIDYSQLNGNWFTTDSITDLNKDGLVNSIDFSFINQHWFINGDS